MYTTTDAIIERFQALKVEFDNAEQRLRQMETKKMQKCNAMFSKIPSKYIQSVWNQLEEFGEDWKRAQENEQCSNIENIKIFNRLLERTLRRFEIYFRECDCQWRSTYLALISHVRKTITTQYQLFKKLCTNATSLDIDSRDLLEYEYKLYNREISMKLIIGSHYFRDSFASVKERYPTYVFENYLSSCIQFHSHIQVYNLFDGVDDFLKRIGFIDSSNMKLQSEQREKLEVELKTFEITLSLSPSMRVEMTFRINEGNPTEDIDVVVNRNYYPSQDLEILESHEETISILEALRIHRWLVCLGETGSRKSILARYLTRSFAECLQQRSYTETVIDGMNLGPPRVPILVRVGEFAEWLQDHPNSELIDYIGLTTWFGNQYSSDSVLSKMLVDFIENGHAFIIIDGLDEVATIHSRRRVVEVVKNFMHTYMYSEDLISPFDKQYAGDATTFIPQYSKEDENTLEEVLGVEKYEESYLDQLEQREYQWQYESFFRGNMLIVTSRVTGYHTDPLSGDRVAHCTILPWSRSSIQEFVETWCKHVQNKVKSLIAIIGIEEVLAERQCWPRADDILTKLDSVPYRGKMPTMNPFLLSMICVIYARQYTDSIVTTRIELYEQIINLAIRRWLVKQKILNWTELRAILANLAIYMQRRSSKGDIDEFDLERLIYLVLRELCKKNTKADIRRRTSEFIRLLNEDMGVTAAHALCVYGFIHLSFQEYFAAVYLTEQNDFFSTECNPSTLANLFCQLFGQRRMHEVLLLTMGRISLTWSASNYDHFCNHLVSATGNSIINKYVPTGSILLLTSLNDLIRLPIASSIHNALDALLHVEGYWAMKESCKDLLQTTVSELSSEVLYGWFERVFNSDIENRLKILDFLWSNEHGTNPKELPKWFDVRICDLFSKQLGILAGKSGEQIDLYIEKFLILASTIDPEMLPNPENGLKEYLMKYPTAITQLNSKILATIITLFGGLQKSTIHGNNDEEKEGNSSMTFSPQHMHRTSPLSYLFVQYLENQSETSEEVKLQYLIDQCKNILCKNTPTRLETIHSYVVLFSLTGIDKFITRDMELVEMEGLIRHMKLTLYYLRNFYCKILHCGFKNFLSKYIVNSIGTLNDRYTNISYTYLVVNACIQLTYFEEQNCFQIPNTIGPEKSLPSPLGPFLVIKISNAVFNRPQVNDWDETTILQFLPFISCISSDLSGSFDFDDGDQTLEDLCLLESEDPKLLKLMIHPFQLLQNKPVIIMLSFFPKHLQSLYQQLFVVNNPSVLPFPHLLIEFLHHAKNFQPYTLRFSILLTILLPIFKEHKMENFLLAFIKQCRDDIEYLKRFNKKISCKTYTKILLKPPVDYISSQRTIEDAIEEERRRISMALNTTDGSSEIYASSICLARLVQVLDKETEISVEVMIEEALIAAEKIENPLWKLDALLVINGCPNTTRFQSRDRDLILELENLLMNSSTTFLGSMALIIRCLLNSERTFQPGRLFHKIFEQLYFQSENEQQTICEAFVQFPSLHLRVCHFIRHETKWTNDDDFNIFNRIFRLHSTECASVFFTKNSSPDLCKILLANMYLSELSVDLIKLENWLTNTTYSRQPYLAISELGNTCLHALEQDKSLVSTEIISNLSIYFAHFAESSISPTVEDYALLQALEHALVNKKLEDAQSAKDFVLQWLSYENHSFLYHCAYMAAELLALSGMQSSEIIEKCCAILISKGHCPHPDVTIRIIRHWQESDEKFFEILLKYLIKEDYAERLPAHLYDELHEGINLKSAQEFQLLIDAERDKYQKTTDKENVSTSRWSLFEMVRTWPTAALKYFLDVLSSLTTITDYPFLTWLLEHMPTKIMSKSTKNKRFCQYLLNILDGEGIPVSLKLIIIQRLSYYQEDDCVRMTLWKIIRRNHKNKNKDDELLTIACLRSLHRKRQVNLNEEELHELQLLRKCSSFSNELQQAVLIGLYMHISREPEYYDVLEVYLCYMINIGDDSVNTLDEEDQEHIEQKTADWILRYRSILLNRFVEDLCKRLNILSADLYAYIYVADLIGNKIREKFCDVIRESTMGENAFKSSLYLACQTKLTENNEHISHCVQVYAYFYEFTCDYASMLLKLKDHDLSRKLFHSISQYQINRDAIDFLLNTLNSKSSSHCERFCAGQLLFRLEEAGYVSIVEIQETIISVIENYGSENNQSDYDLKRLLFDRMLHDLYDPEENPKISLSSIASLKLSPCTAAPAIVFVSS